MAKLRAATVATRIAMLDMRTARPPPKVAEPIYSTPEYRLWRDAVIERAHGYCQDPVCARPNRRPSRLFADHIVELRDGGAPFDLANGMALCGSCHSRKTAAERARRAATSWPSPHHVTS